jgi:hypothetical protein
MYLNMITAQLCPRCNKEVEKFDPMQKVCFHCRDILEFGYPSFAAYPLKETANKEESKRMEISEGWVLPSYLFNKNK